MPRPKYCWDSCVFISLLTGEPRPEADRIGLFEVVDLVDRDQATIITSALVRTEVLDRTPNSVVRASLDGLFRRPTFVVMDLSGPIADRAGAIRQRVIDEGGSVRTPDAIFIATAIAHRADALHTFDDRLLRLSGSAHVEGLTICKPHAVQTVLPL
jgi:predicted nucleic acid-binding protein